MSRQRATRWWWIATVAGAALALASSALGQDAPSSGKGPVVVVELDSAIDKVSARFLERALDGAEEDGARLVVIRIDTPGGLLDATRDMVGDVFGSRVPVVSYVAPEGAQAASAGTFVASSAAFVAMAPATNIGAASVVGAGGEDLPETLSRKATEDAAALIRSIAARRGRPVAPLEATVREASSYSAAEAVDLGIADLVASDLDRLLAEIDGRTLDKASGSRSVRTAGAEIRTIEMNVFEQMLAFLADPNIAFLLISLGALALAVEIWSPGLWVPGALGVLFLVLGFGGIGFLPFSWAAVVLLGLAVLFFVLEALNPGVGLFGAFGTAGLLLRGDFLLGGSGLPRSAPCAWLPGARCDSPARRGARSFWAVTRPRSASALELPIWHSSASSSSRSRPRTSLPPSAGIPGGSDGRHPQLRQGLRANRPVPLRPVRGHEGAGDRDRPAGDPLEGVGRHAHRGPRHPAADEHHEGQRPDRHRLPRVHARRRQRGGEGSARGRGLPLGRRRARDDDAPRGDRRHPARRRPLAERPDQRAHPPPPRPGDQPLGDQSHERRDPGAHAAAGDPGRDEPADVRGARPSRRRARGRGDEAGERHGRRRREAGGDPSRGGRQAGGDPPGRGVQGGADPDLRGGEGRRREDDDAPVPRRPQGARREPVLEVRLPARVHADARRIVRPLRGRRLAVASVAEPGGERRLVRARRVCRELAAQLADGAESLRDDVVRVDGLEIHLLGEQEVCVVELGQRLERVTQRVPDRVLHEPRLQVRVLDDEELVWTLQEVVDRRAHRALRDLDEDLGIEVVLGPDEERLAAALVVRRNGDELEDPVHVGRLVPGLEQALRCSVPDEALSTRAGVDPGRLDADDAPRPLLGRRRDPTQGDHLLRREARHGRPSVDRPLRANPDLRFQRGLALDNPPCDVLGEHLDEERLALDDEVDRLLEELGEARHVDALLVGREIDGAVDDGGHYRLGVAPADPHRLLDAADPGT